MAGEEKSVTKRVGMIKNIHTPNETSKRRWDEIFHKDENCPLAKRIEGCLVCDDLKNKQKPNN